MNDEKLLEWILSQDRLRIETWNTAQGEQVRVWTIFDDEDFPSGKAETAREALEMAATFGGSQ